MHARLLMCAVLAGTVTAGCRSNPGQELLEQEMRWLEDKKYELEEENENLRLQLESAQDAKPAAEDLPLSAQGSRAQGASTGRVRVDGAPAYQGPPPIAPPDPRIPEGEHNDQDRAELARQPSGERSPVKRRLKPGSPAKQTVRRSRGRPQSSSARGVRPAKAKPETLAKALRSDPAESPPLANGPRAPAGADVTMITLDHEQTGGRGKSGVRGLVVVIEPRGADGEIKHVTGKVSIVVLDPAETGQRARVARWDFSAAETDELCPLHPPGGGLRFDLDWPGESPRHTPLKVYVRFTTDDGRWLSTERQVDLDATDPATDESKNP